MKLNNIIQLNEKHYTGPLYHVTKPHNFVNMLQKDIINFSDSYDQSFEREMIPRKGYRFFLSTARSLVNYFRKDSMHSSSSPLYNGYVSMILDTQKINRNNDFLIRPTDYFGQSYTYKESEERIWSKSSSSLKISEYVREIHMYVENPGNVNFMGQEDNWYVKYIFQILDYLKKFKHIPTYFYNDKKAYMIHNKNKSISDPDKLRDKLYGLAESILENDEENIITEKHYRGPLYHVTSFLAAQSIISNSYLKFQAVLNDKNEQRLSDFAGKDFNHYLSTARSMFNFYYSELEYDNTINSPVLIIFNAEYFSNLGRQYKIMPVSYYGSEAYDKDKFGKPYPPPTKDFHRESKETEERIWSTDRKQDIDVNKAIKAVHALTINYDKIPIENQLKALKQACEKTNTQLTLYDKLKDFKTFRNGKRVV